MANEPNKTFAALFKKYRLRSEIETLAEFGDLMAREGLVYENSLYTHWQKGDRVPKDRKILLTMIKIFVSRGGIRSLDECNLLMASVFQRDVEVHEIIAISKTSINISHCEIQRSYQMHNKISDLKLRKLIKGKYAYWIIILFITVTIWHLRIWKYQLYNTRETDILGNTYGLLALSSGIYMYRISRTRRDFINPRLASAANWFSYGLVGQWIGLVIWSIYTQFKVSMPYPSLADFGYFSLVPCYILGTICLLENGSKYLKTMSSKKRWLLLLFPLLILGFCYSFVLNVSGIGLQSQLRIILDTTYPLGEIVPILIVLYILISPSYKLNTLAKRIYILLLAALSFQFVAEYAFIYIAQLNQYVNGGFNDYLYATSYLIMNLTITVFTSEKLKDFAVDYISNHKETKEITKYFLSTVINFYKLIKQ